MWRQEKPISLYERHPTCAAMGRQYFFFPRRLWDNKLRLVRGRLSSKTWGENNISPDVLCFSHRDVVRSDDDIFNLQMCLQVWSVGEANGRWRWHNHVGWAAQSDSRSPVREHGMMFCASGFSIGLEWKVERALRSTLIIHDDMASYMISLRPHKRVA